MAGLRELMRKRPWIAWLIALACLGVAGYQSFWGSRSRDPYSPDRMTEDVTIRYADTGEEVTMRRGAFEKMLRSGSDLRDPSQGLINPQTQQPTGFLVARKEWDETIARINSERQRNIDRAKGSTMGGSTTTKK